MAEKPDIEIIPTEREVRYTLRSMVEMGHVRVELPTWMVFTCERDGKVLGVGSFLFSTGMEAEVWAFWKPILEKFAEGREIEIRIDGGFPLGPPVAPGTKDLWAPAVPAPGKEDSHIEVMESVRRAPPGAE